MVRCCYIYKISCIDSTYCNYLNEKQTFVVIPLTSSTALSMSFIAGSLSMFILCYLLKSSFNVAKKPLKCRSLGATHSHTQFKMAVNYSLIGTKIVLAGLNIFFNYQLEECGYISWKKAGIQFLGRKWNIGKLLEMKGNSATFFPYIFHTSVKFITWQQEP